MKINFNITTVTVTFNNADELTRTLESLAIALCQPFEIIVVDGGSTDGSVEIIESFMNKLPQLKFSSRKDNGIFDALNIGKRQVTTSLVHYLTAGDILYGNPYKDIERPALLPVIFVDETGKECGRDRIKLFGTGYNHQGMILPTEHREYDTNLWVGADYKMSLETFPKGLSSDLFVNNGGVKYQLGGLSTQRNGLVAYQLIVGVFSSRPLLAIPVTCALLLKSLVPRNIRRWLLKRL